jgi:hypothetical protein
MTITITAHEVHHDIGEKKLRIYCLTIGSLAKLNKVHPDSGAVRN